MKKLKSLEIDSFWSWMPISLRRVANSSLILGSFNSCLFFLMWNSKQLFITRLLLIPLETISFVTSLMNSKYFSCSSLVKNSFFFLLFISIYRISILNIYIYIHNKVYYWIEHLNAKRPVYLVITLYLCLLFTWKSNI